MTQIKSFFRIFLDARILVFLNNFTLVMIGMTLLGVQRTWLQVGVGLSSAVITEFLFLYFQRGVREFKWYHFGSSIVAGIGSILVMNGTDWWIYGVLSFIAISSKYLLKKNKTDHIFNPINFAIIFFLAISSTNSLRIYADQFAMSKYILYQVLAMGLIICYLANRLVLVFTYAFTFIALGLLVPLLSNKMNFYDIVGSEMGVGALIFLFFMITDPRTSPHSWKGQFVWAIFIASFSVLMKYNEVYHSRFVALFVATALGGLYEVSRRSNGRFYTPVRTSEPLAVSA